MKKLTFLGIISCIILLTMFLFKTETPLKKEILKSEEQNKDQAPTELLKVSWQTFVLPPANNEDVISDTLSELKIVLSLLEKTAGNDKNLMRLIRKYEQTASKKEEFVSVFKKLHNLKLDYIGQFHESGLGSEKEPIEEIQLFIATKIRREYQVAWMEDFLDGEIITSENAWKQLLMESKESDIPEILTFATEEYTKAIIEGSISRHASYQLIYNPTTGVEVRGVDRHSVRAIHQQLMNYETLHQLGKQMPSTEVFKYAKKIVKGLNNARNLYIIKTIVEQGDPTKKNVLVLGFAHTDHIVRIMANYGVKARLFIPITHK